MSSQVETRDYHVHVYKIVKFVHMEVTASSDDAARAEALRRALALDPKDWTVSPTKHVAISFDPSRGASGETELDG